MRISILKALGSLLTSFLGVLGNVDARNEAVAEAPRAAVVEQVPQAVVDAVKFAYPAGILDLDGVEKDVDDDETTYEVPLMNHGDRFKVEVDSEGAIKEIEGELAPLELPGAVTKALAERFRFGATTTAEEHVKVEHGRETKVFKLVVVFEGKPLDVKITPDGVIEDVDD